MEAALDRGKLPLVSTSLRDQLLKAGLISKQQANEAERQQQRQERRPTRNPGRVSAIAPAPKAPSVQGAKVARDQALERKRQEKADKKARLAQIKQLIEHSRLPVPDEGEPYSFIDGAKIRRITIDGSLRRGLGRGEIAIVRNDGGYDLVPASAAVRIQQRDGDAVVKLPTGTPSVPSAGEEGEHPVPDDLIW